MDEQKAVDIFFLMSQASLRAQRKKRVEGRSDFHRHPPRLSARRQDLKIGVQIIAALYTAEAQGQRPPPLQADREHVVLTVGRRGYCSSTRVGSVAPLGNTKEDEYYRNDSMKYCRHEEKRRKEEERTGRWARLNTREIWSVHDRKFSMGGAWSKSPTRSFRDASHDVVEWIQRPHLFVNCCRQSLGIQFLLRDPVPYFWSDHLV
jgi:hypothetical protein